jgi:hypothetical protein
MILQDMIGADLKPVRKQAGSDLWHSLRAFEAVSWVVHSLPAASPLIREIYRCKRL